MTEYSLQSSTQKKRCATGELLKNPWETTEIPPSEREFDDTSETVSTFISSENDEDDNEFKQTGKDFDEENEKNESNENNEKAATATGNIFKKVAKQRSKFEECNENFTIRNLTSSGHTSFIFIYFQG